MTVRVAHHTVDLQAIGPKRRLPVPKSSAEAVSFYDDTYYRHYCCSLPYGRLPHWLRQFSVLADALVREIRPRTVLDVGCAFGLLVEALRSRDVDAWGIDLSPFAISQVETSTAPFCRVGSVTEDLGGPYDLVTCIEVLEHLPPVEEVLALDRLCSAASVILFSSSPDNFEEATHFNVRPIRYWLDRFAERGFVPDPRFDASFLAPHALLFRRRSASSQDLLDAMDALIRGRCEAARKQNELAATGPVTFTQLQQALDAAEERIRVMEGSFGWRVLTGYRRWLRETVRTRPWLARVYEPLVNRVVRGGAARSKEKTGAEHTRAFVENIVSGGDLVLCCDSPGSDGETVTSDILTVSGWACARQGIRSLKVKGIPVPESALWTGLPSPDLAPYLVGFADADRARFSVRISTRQLEEKSYQVEVEAESNAGERSRVVRVVRVRKSNSYANWISRVEPNLWVEPIPSPATGPLISIVTPVFRTPPDVLKACVASVQRQTYTKWQLCLVDDASGDATLSSLLEEFSQDPRILVQTLETNQGIAGATNQALAMTSGDYVGFLDHDDELAPQAVAEVVAALSSENAPEVLYSDEDKLTPGGERFDPFFKPDFSLDLLRSANYVCHFLVARRELLLRVGGIRLGFDGSQDHDLVLRLAEQTEAIRRIPKVLYHWRAIPGSTADSSGAKPIASKNGRLAVEQHFHRLGISARVTEEAAGQYRAHHVIHEQPEVDILVPTGGRMDHLTELLSSLKQNLSYDRFRLWVIDNSSGESVKAFVQELGDSRIQWMDFRREPFNFSRLCNQAAAKTLAPLLLFLNDDTRAIHPDWLSVLAGYFSDPKIGVIGPILLYPDNTIQHAGIVMGMHGLAGHILQGAHETETHYNGLPRVSRNVAAVTGACLLTRRDIFLAVGGFNEVDLPVSFQDVDYCLKVWEQGLRVVLTPHVRLYHLESASRGRLPEAGFDHSVAWMKARWARWIEDDPFYNPHLSRTMTCFDLGT